MKERQKERKEGRKESTFLHIHNRNASLPLSLSLFLFSLPLSLSVTATMAQFVFWVMGQRVGPEPNKAWEYVAGPFNSFLLADAHLVAHMREWCDFCVFKIQAVRVWRS